MGPLHGLHIVEIASIGPAGGKPVPPLGAAERTIVDVGVSAAALLARKPETANGSEAGINAPQSGRAPRT